MGGHKGDLQLRILLRYNTAPLSLALIKEEAGLLQLITVKVVAAQDQDPDGRNSCCLPDMEAPGLCDVVQRGLYGPGHVVAGAGFGIHAGPLIGSVVGVDDDRILNPLVGMERFGDLGRIFLYEAAGYVDQFLGIAVSVFNPQHGGRAHLFLEAGKESNVRSAEGIDGLPVIPYGDDLCVADFPQRPGQIEALPGDVLILVYDDVFEVQPMFHLRAFPEGSGGVVDHIFEVHRLQFLQDLLVFQIAGLADLQKEPGTDVGCGFFHNCELHFCIAVGLEVGDKAADQQYKVSDIAVAFVLQDLSEDLLIRAGMQFYAVRQQFFLQVFRQGPSVPVAGESIDQFCSVPAMEQDLFIDGILISLEALFIIAVVAAVACDSEMLDIDFSVSLPDYKIRCIGLSGQFYVIAIDRFVGIIDAVPVEEVGDFHLLGRTQDFIADGDFLFPLGVHDLCRVFVQLAAHSGIAHLRDAPEKGFQVIFIQWRVKIGGEKEDQTVDQSGVFQNSSP